MPYTYTGSLRHGRPHHDGAAAGGHPRRRRRALREAAGVGANCGVGASDILASLLDMTEARPGCDRHRQGQLRHSRSSAATEIHYSGTPELMADYVAAGGRRRRQNRRRLLRHHASATSPRCARRSTRTRRPSARPSQTIVERIGPMRNKQATANTAETSEARRERRRSRAA